MNDSRTIEELVNAIQYKHYVDFEDLSEMCLELEKLSREKNDSFGLSCAQINMSYYYMSNGMYAEASGLLTQGVELAEQHKYLDLMLRGYNTTALLYKNLADDNMALEFFMKSMLLADELENHEYMGKVLNNIGDMFLQLKNYELASPYFVESYTYAKKQAESPNKYLSLAVVLLNIAEVEQHLGKYQESLEHTMECEMYSNKINTTIFMDAVYGYKAIAHYYLGSKEKATRCVDALIGTMNNAQQDDLVNSLDLYCKMIGLCIEMKDLKRCEIFAKKAIELGEQLQTPIFKMMAIEWNIKYRKALLDNADLNDLYEYYFRNSMENNVLRSKNRVNSLQVKLDLMSTVLEKQQIEKVNEELKELSSMDELTGIPNRRSFNKQLSKTFVKMKQDSELGIVIIDVDYFKQYNDHYGHLAGDDVLKKVANCLKSDNPHIYPTRFGGDEFIVIAAALSKEQLEEYLTNVYNKIKECNIEHCKSPSSNIVTLSAGYCHGVIRDLSIKNVVEQADEALYRAKEDGRNRFYSYN